MKNLLLIIPSILLMLTALNSTALNKHIPIYGHRGARGLAPENTIPAYKTGLDIGIDYVDMDVNITKDGVVVVAHNFALNPDFTRDSHGSWIGNKKIFIKNLTFKQLQQYDVGRLKPSRLGQVGKVVGAGLGKMMPRGFKNPDDMVKNKNWYLAGDPKKKKKMRLF